MKKILILLLMLWGTAQAQTVGQFRYDTTKFLKVGGINHLVIDSILRTMDTTLFKPLVIDAGGRIRQSNYWFGSGGGSGTYYPSLNLASQYILALNDSTIYFDSCLVATDITRVGDSLKLISGCGVRLGAVYAPVGGGSSQWNDNANGIDYMAGNVGIGNNLPTNLLDLVKNHDGGTALNILNNSSGSSALTYINVSNGTGAFQAGVLGINDSISTVRRQNSVFFQSNDVSRLVFMSIDSANDAPIIFAGKEGPLPSQEYEWWRMSFNKSFSNTGLHGVAPLDVIGNASSLATMFIKAPPSGVNIPIVAAADASGRAMVFGEQALTISNFAVGGLQFNVSSAGGTIGAYSNINTAAAGTLIISGGLRLSSYGAGSLSTDASGNINVTSDIRLKKNIHDFKVGLKEVLKLNPITYSWNEKSGNETKGTYAGFSAQNVRDAIPFGTGVMPDGHLTLQDRAIMASLVNAVKELSSEVEKLKKIIATK